MNAQNTPVLPVPAEGQDVPSAAPALRPRASRRPQDAAQKKLEQTRKQIDNVQDDIVKGTRVLARLAKTLRALQANERYYAKRAAMTDSEVEAERQKTKEQEEARARRKARRGIAIGGDL